MPSGPGVRVDTHIEAGDPVPADYDNLIAKLLVHAHDRDAAIDRLRRALDETEIGGVQTTLPFHRAVARSAAFRGAALSTGWVDANWDGESARAEAVRKALLATGLEAVGHDEGVGHDAAVGGAALSPAPAVPGAPSGRNGWRSGGRFQGVDRWPG
jgi:acetyl/propionyl-CoA carboxylase alpha subunit